MWAGRAARAEAYPQAMDVHPDAVRALTVDDVEWAVSVLGRRRDLLVPYAPIFWAPAEGAVGTHQAYLRHLLSDAGAVGWRTDESVLVAARHGDGWLVDDAAWTPQDGAALWGAFAAGCADDPVRVVCSRYEPERRELVLAAGLQVEETWWLRELSGSGGEPGLRVDLPGASARTVPAPPVYAPPGPMFDVTGPGDLADVAPAAVETAERLGCAGVVIRVGRDGATGSAALAANGFRPHCDFLTGVVRKVGQRPQSES